MNHDAPQNSVPYLLGQLTAKVDLLLTNQKATNLRHEALENRVSTLEKDKAKIIGAALVISTVGTYGLNLLLK
jgi:hypothetical protein